MGSIPPECGDGVSRPTEGVDVPVYCRIHAQRAEAEGLTKTALVLEWAAAEIEALRKQITELQTKAD